MTDKKIIDVEYNDIENVIYLSAPQMAKKVGTTEATIRTWADMYGDLIGIEKINGRKTYKETQVSSFAFIKDLVDNKNMHKTQVRNYISKHGFKYAEFDSGLIDPKDPLGFEALASALSVEVKKDLNNFKEDMTKEILTQIKQYMMVQGEAINNTLDNTILKVDEVVEEKITQLQQENNEKLKNEISKKLEEHSKQTLETQDKQLQSFISELNEKQSEIAMTSEDQRKNIVEKIDRFNELTKNTNKNQTETLKKLVELSNTTSRMERRKNEEESKKENGLFNKIKSIFKNSNED